MFERFTNRGRRIVVLAQEQARELNHGYIGTEHLLLGVLAAGGPTAEAMRGLGLTYAAARLVVVNLGVGGSPPSGHIPFTPNAKRALEASLKEALSRGDSYIGSQHIMLGLVREPKDYAHRVVDVVLQKLNMTTAAVRQVLADITPDEAEGMLRAPSPRPPEAIWRGRALMMRRLLTEWCDLVDGNRAEIVKLGDNPNDVDLDAAMVTARQVAAQVDVFYDRARDLLAEEW